MAYTSEEIDQVILDAASSGPVLESALAAALGIDRAAVATHCRRLQLKSTKVTELDVSIVGTLTQNGDGLVPTANLTEAVNADPDREAAHKTKMEAVPAAKPDAVYRHCHRLERFGVFRSEVAVSSRRLYFFPLTGDVLNHANYDGVEKVIGDLKRIVERYRLKPGSQIAPSVKSRLQQDFDAYLDRLAAKEPAHSAPIKSFKRELTTVLRGTRKSDVVGLFGVRPFSPKIRTWGVEGLPAKRSIVLPGGVVYQCNPGFFKKGADQQGDKQGVAREAAQPRPAINLLPGETIWVSPEWLKKRRRQGEHTRVA